MERSAIIQRILARKAAATSVAFSHRPAVHHRTIESATLRRTGKIDQREIGNALQERRNRGETFMCDVCGGEANHSHITPTGKVTWSKCDRCHFADRPDERRIHEMVCTLGTATPLLDRLGRAIDRLDFSRPSSSPTTIEHRAAGPMSLREKLDQARAERWEYPTSTPPARRRRRR